jgi:hypothetical protein
MQRRAIKIEEWSRELPGQGIKYGYTLRDYRDNTDGELRWSWAIEYHHDKGGRDVTKTDYNYAMTRIGAIIAARIALIKAAARAAKELSGRPY